MHKVQCNATEIFWYWYKHDQSLVKLCLPECVDINTSPDFMPLVAKSNASNVCGVGIYRGPLHLQYHYAFSYKFVLWS